MLSLLALAGFMEEFKLISIMAVLEWSAYISGIAESDDARTALVKDAPISGIGDLIQFSEAMGFLATRDSLIRMVRNVDDYVDNEAIGTADLKSKSIELITGLREIRRNFIAESGGLMFLCIDRERMKYWSKPLAGWEDVIAVLDGQHSKDKLSASTVEEQIVEAGRCLASGRGTACVLHLNNVLEVGMKRLRRKLPGTTQKTKELDGFIKAIEAYTNKQPTPSDAEQMRSVAVYCVAVRMAWRHPVAHADMIFTEEAAYEAYVAMRGLMREIVKL